MVRYYHKFKVHKYEQALKMGDWKTQKVQSKGL